MSEGMSWRLLIDDGLGQVLHNMVESVSKP